MRKTVLPLVTLVLLSFIQSNPASDDVVIVAETPVSGVISVDTVWNYTGSPYNVTGDVTVAPNVTLTIESGVEVLFNKDRALYVEGTLTTLATLENRTVFTSALSPRTPGDWVGLCVNSTGRAFLNFTDIAYAYTALSSISQNPLVVVGGMVSDFEEKGAYVEYSSWARLSDLQVRGTYPNYFSTDGIFLKNTGNSTVSNVTVSEAFNGIKVSGGASVNISDSDIFDNVYGIESGMLAGLVRIENNSIHDNSGGGAWVLGRGILQNNEVYDNTGYGLALGWSANSLARRNTVYSTQCTPDPIYPEGHGIAVYCTEPGCSKVTIEENTLYGNCGASIQANHMVNSTIRNNNLTGYIILLSSHYNAIEGNRIRSGGIALEMDQHLLADPSHDNQVQDNQIGPNAYAAVFLEDAYDNVISGNTMVDNFNGVLLVGAGYNLIESNILDGNFYGIRAKSGGWIWHPSLTTKVADNHISSGGRGIFIEDAYEFEITGNCIFNNTRGVYVSSLAGYQNLGSSIVYGNTFLLNNESGHADGGYVVWNSSYPDGGNFWSDYIGTDNFTGPNQDIPGSDGIGDTTYAVDSDDFDFYPLMEALCQPCGGVDLKVARDDIVVVSDPPHFPWDSLVVNVTVENIGTQTATNVTVQLLDGSKEDGAVIEGNKTVVSLQPGERANVTVNWSLPSKGTHLICALVDPENLVPELSKINNYACRNVYIDEGLAPSPPTNVNAYLSGNMLENVTVQWELSPDDTGLPSGVVTYDIYESNSYSTNRSTYALIGSVPSGQSYFVHQKKGEGNTGNHFYFACAVNGFTLSSCSDGQAAKFTRTLAKGLNLVSIPLMQSNESIETVLQATNYDKAWYYDSSSRQWIWYMKDKTYKGTLWNVNHTIGLWVNVTEGSNLTVAGVVPAQTTIQLFRGWNLVSFPSFNATYTVSDLKVEVGATSVEGYDPATPYHLRVLGGPEVPKAGYGYWVKVEADTPWIVGIQ